MANTKEAKMEKKAPVKKQSYSLSDYKAEKKLNDEVKDKAMEFIPMSKAFREVLGMDIPKGYVSLIRGFSNVGKSTALIEAIVGAQKIGTLPVIIDSENNFSFEHAKLMGMEFEEVKDDKTGEVKSYEGFFIYINNNYLIENYGKIRDKNRDEAVIEDVAEAIHNLIDDQNAGKLPYDLLFCWDSIGTLDCEQSVVGKNRNNMWNAGSMSVNFNSLLNHRIPGSRKENSKYTNTFIGVQKIWLDSMQGAGIIKHKGGEAAFYASRLIFHLGGITSHGTKRLTATANGRDYAFGIETKIGIVKNHVNGISYTGTIVSTPHGFVKSDDIDNYKKENKKYLLSKLDLSDGEINIRKDDSDIAPDSEN